MSESNLPLCGLKPGDCPGPVSTNIQPIKLDKLPPTVMTIELIENLDFENLPPDFLPPGVNWKSVYDTFTETTGLVPRSLEEFLKNQADAESSLRQRGGGFPLQESKSRELRAGILYRGCDCERRNGLQDMCARNQCHGSPQCLTIPPTCPPSQFSNAKHLQAKMKPPKKPGELTFSQMCGKG